MAKLALRERVALRAAVDAADGVWVAMYRFTEARPMARGSKPVYRRKTSLAAFKRALRSKPLQPEFYGRPNGGMRWSYHYDLDVHGSYVAYFFETAADREHYEEAVKAKEFRQELAALVPTPTRRRDRQAEGRGRQGRSPPKRNKSGGAL